MFIEKVYIHGGSFMLGGYIGAGPRKLLERDMVFIWFVIWYLFLISVPRLSNTFFTGACLLTIQGGASWLPLSS